MIFRVQSILHKQIVYCLSVISLLLWPAHGFDIVATSGNWEPINIYVENFQGEEKFSSNFPSKIISRDLTSSGNFRAHSKIWEPHNDQKLNAIRAKGGEYLLSGSITSLTIDSYQIKFTLTDIITKNKIGSYQIGFDLDNQRLAAHNIANWIYEEVVGKPGIFHTKVVYVLRHADGKNELKIADYDGANRTSVLSSDNTIISPAWTPDGNGLLYVSFERNKPIIYEQSLLTGERGVIANYKGSNSAPASAPDNRTVAAALTEHGGPQQIYLITDDRKIRMREVNAINTEPVFSTDGEHIVYTSDEAGSPQIYQYNLTTNKNRRLTFNSRYNVSADYSHDNNSIVFVSRNEKRENITYLDINSQQEEYLTIIRRAASPSFAPNDDIVIFRDEDRKKYLATVSINGKVMLYWEVPEIGEIINPAWSPAKSDWF